MILRPKVKVTKENRRYLKILDIISNRFNVHIEVKNAHEIIKKYITEYSLNINEFLYWASFYKIKETYKNISLLLKEEILNDAA